jgi:ABC-type histidine transport system ATPase subunit
MQTERFLLHVNNIEVVYNDIIQVLRGVSLNIQHGSIVSLLGTQWRRENNVFTRYLRAFKAGKWLYS